MLTVIDEYSRECLAIDVERRLRCDDVLAKLTEPVVLHGPAELIRSDNGPEFTASPLLHWCNMVALPQVPIERSFEKIGP